MIDKDKGDNKNENKNEIKNIENIDNRAFKD